MLNVILSPAEKEWYQILIRSLHHDEPEENDKNRQQSYQPSKLEESAKDR